MYIKIDLLHSRTQWHLRSKDLKLLKLYLEIFNQKLNVIYVYLIYEKLKTYPLFKIIERDEKP